MKKSEPSIPRVEVPEPAAAGGEADSPAPIAPGNSGSEKLEELKDRAAKADENWERLIRTTADFENFKKRAARERQDATKFANESLMQKIIPVLDNFEMALAAAQSGSADGLKSLADGIAMIHSQLRQALTDAGLEELLAGGQKFDPNLHEAVAQRDSSEVAEGHVLQQLRKGYKLRERLLRPATVIVATKPAGNSK